MTFRLNIFDKYNEFVECLHFDSYDTAQECVDILAEKSSLKTGLINEVEPITSGLFAADAMIKYYDRSFDNIEFTSVNCPNDCNVGFTYRKPEGKFYCKKCDSELIPNK